MAHEGKWNGMCCYINNGMGGFQNTRAGIIMPNNNNKELTMAFM